MNRRAAAQLPNKGKAAEQLRAMRPNRRFLISLALLVLVAVLSILWLQHSVQAIFGSRASGDAHHEVDIPRPVEQQQPDGDHRSVSLEKEQQEILSRLQSRIPGYLPFSSETYFGYVMRDFSSRVLSRDVVNGADVLIVSKDIYEQTVHDTASRTNQSSSLEQLKHQKSVGLSFNQRAREHGHRVHGLTSLGGNWWANTTEIRPSRILLAVFDPERGQEDAALKDAFQFFLEYTPTYVVFRVTSFGNGHRGALALRVLEQLGYKVQVLSCSHFVEGYGPNEIIHQGNVVNFLESGKARAMDKSNVDRVFNSYLFATQGLDLAIPSAREHFSSGYFRTKNGRINLPFKRCPLSGVTLAFRPNEKAAKAAMEKYGTPEEKFVSNFRVHCGNKVVVNHHDLAHFWMSNDNPELAEAICVTLKSCRKDHLAGLGQTACATRIVPVTTDDKLHLLKSDPDDSVRGESNLLVVMINPLSRPLFDQSLPKTKALLNQMGFTSFDKHTVVGDDSGPNQAALFAGHTLSNREGFGSPEGSSSWIWDILKDDAGYVTYKAKDGCVRNSEMSRTNTTHGFVIQEMMCYDFSRPNCVGGKAAANHLAEHAGRFIETYSKLQQKWAAFVHFVDSHEDTNMLAVSLDDPIFSLLYGLRTRMKREVLDNTFIVILSAHGLHYGSFLQSRQGKRERASPILFMKPPRHLDGSESVASALRKNKVMWTTPFDVHATMRHVMLGENYALNGSVGSSLLNPLHRTRNRCRDTAPIPDRYCELFEELDPSSLVEHVEMVSPASVLSFFADIPNTQKTRRSECLNGDALDHRFHESTFSASCLCSTSHRNWYTCRNHPWQREAQNSSGAVQPHEYFALIDCPGNSLHMETRLERDPAILKRLDEVKSSEETETAKPNILFIELDSVSVAYADRHFPKTRELLHSLRIESRGDEVHCPSNVCSAEFSWFSIAGPNSIVNQVSALSGCITVHHTQKCNNNTKNMLCEDEDMIQYGMRYYKRFIGATIWCPPLSDPNKRHSSPWLFDVAERSGYVTLFGEEFCYEKSPFVTQDNVFPLEADIMVHRVHCRLAERRLRKNGLRFVGMKLWSRAAGFNLRCIDGDTGTEKSVIPLEHIKRMWDAYGDEPKFAFLNAIAAHDYSESWSDMSLGAESYDDMMAAFLKRMISRKDANQTVIVVRSDHGLQGGPTTVDFSTQVEHSRPWTEIIVPKSLKGLSLKHLSSNQDRLVTGFDLHRMMRDVMSPTHAPGSASADLRRSLPTWAINVLTTEVPRSRSCRNARVAPQFCRNEHERISVGPSYGMCNQYDKRLRPYCVMSSEDRVEAVTSAPTMAGEKVALIAFAVAAFLSLVVFVPFMARRCGRPVH